MQPGGVGGTHSRRMPGRAGWWEAQIQDAGADGDEVWLPQNWPFQQNSGININAAPRVWGRW